MAQISPGRPPRPPAGDDGGSPLSAADVAARLGQAQARIAQACARAGRDPSGVRLLPVTKTHAADVVRWTVAAGYRRCGENRVQELVAKAAALPDVPVEWAVIGHVQTNKAALAARWAVEVQSVESVKLAAALQRRCEALDRRLDILIEVNTSGEASKFGLRPDEAEAFTAALRPFDRLRPRGLMTLALPSTDPARVAPCFETLVGVRDRLRQRDGGGWDELSMGMSGDFEWAIERGSTCVRLGTVLFGPRG